MTNKLFAEFIGTLFLVFCGCGSAVIAAGVPDVGIGLLGVSLSFGLIVLVLAYSLGPISGGHFNPAVSVGLAVAGRFSYGQLIPYIVAQVIGASVGAGLLYLVASGKTGFELGGFAANGYGEHSPGGYSMLSALLVEVILMYLFMTVILGATHKRAAAGFAPIAIGLVLAIGHLVSIPVDNTSLNPARSTSQALFVGGWALQQLWLFWVAPIVGAALAGITWKVFGEND